MNPKRPEPTLELVFEGSKLYPERVPFNLLSRAVSAVQRLGDGDAPAPDDEEPGEEGVVRLIGVKRGSAVFRLWSAKPAPLLDSIEQTARVLNDPEAIGENDYILPPLEELSAAARSLGCVIVLRRPDGDRAILARIGPDAYENVSRASLVVGDTAFSGSVQRVGGATEPRCALRVLFRRRLLYCRVATPEVARFLGQRLYEDVVVQGTARWLKGSWRVVSFTIKSASQPEAGSPAEAFEALRRAGGDAWDNVPDPRSFLEGVGGQPCQ